MPFHVSPLILATALGCGVLLLPGPARAADEVQTADVLVKLFKAGRTVVSEHQAVINDASKGDKGFTPAYFVDRVIDKFRDQTKIDLRQPPEGAQTRLLLTLVESGREVVEEAQPVINKQGVAFKGFLPAVWARKTGERFTRKTGLRLKLTASVWRYPGNRPDEFLLSGMPWSAEGRAGHHRRKEGRLQRRRPRWSHQPHDSGPLTAEPAVRVVDR